MQLPRIVSGNARSFAEYAHGDQRYGYEPYVKHLDDVVMWLRIFGFADDETIRGAAYLHDVLEDTDVTFDQIRNEFGMKVAQIVSAVTDEPGANRKERNAKTYPKIAAGSTDALTIKLADRIANVFVCLQFGDLRLAMYQKEHAEFRKALKRCADVDRDAMWEFLDRLIRFERRKQ